MVSDLLSDIIAFRSLWPSFLSPPIITILLSQLITFSPPYSIPVPSLSNIFSSLPILISPSHLLLLSSFLFLLFYPLKDLAAYILTIEIQSALDLVILRSPVHLDIVEGGESVAALR